MSPPSICSYKTLRGKSTNPVVATMGRPMTCDLAFCLPFFIGSLLAAARRGDRGDPATI